MSYLLSGTYVLRISIFCLQTRKKTVYYHSDVLVFQGKSKECLVYIFLDGPEARRMSMRPLDHQRAYVEDLLQPYATSYFRVPSVHGQRLQVRDVQGGREVPSITMEMRRVPYIFLNTQPSSLHQLAWKP